jgi:hypothetical protein
MLLNAHALTEAAAKGGVLQVGVSGVKGIPATDLIGSILRLS